MGGDEGEMLGGSVDNEGVVEIVAIRWVGGVLGLCQGTERGDIESMTG
jgi:hypothetical protein